MPADLFEPCRDPALFRPLSPLPFVHLDLRYASADNICGYDLYNGVQEAWLRPPAYEALLVCGAALQAALPHWRLRVFDATRPTAVQEQLFAKVVGTSQQAYVADPALGSVHNYGFALDLGLSDPQGQEADLGSPFDSFDPLSQPQLEEAFAAQGRLSAAALQLRRHLRAVMAAGGYRQHPLEWWHFELLGLEELRYSHVQI